MSLKVYDSPQFNKSFIRVLPEDTDIGSSYYFHFIANEFSAPRIVHGRLTNKKFSQMVILFYRFIGKIIHVIVM
jgi:hypothetical protein